MQVRVLYFGVLKELFQRAEERVELSEPASVGTLLEVVRRGDDGLWGSLAVAVNREYVDAGWKLSDGDEVALLPPVSGGAGPETLDVVFQKVRAAEAAWARSGSFDCAPRDEAARGSAQDDGFLGRLGKDNRRSFDCATHDKTVNSFAQDDTSFTRLRNFAQDDTSFGRTSSARRNLGREA